ncbi:MAG: hypothetical protein M0Z96_00785 [Actinomycetota bacterium]|nr:hypothetical protein [Actinomycetota bacterium]
MSMELAIIRLSYEWMRIYELLPIELRLKVWVVLVGGLVPGLPTFKAIPTEFDIPTSPKRYLARND